MDESSTHAPISELASRRYRSTGTRSFGSSGRNGHDARVFYARFPKTDPPVEGVDAVVRPVKVDEIVTGDARIVLGDESIVAPGSVALVVTSPPYFVGKDYETDGAGGVPGTWEGYIDLLDVVMGRCAEVLEPGGRICLNVANLGRKPYVPLSQVVSGLMVKHGLLLRGEIIWRKARGAGGSAAWGTFRDARNPVLRDLTERVLVASKGGFCRAGTAAERRQAALPHHSSISASDFMAATVDVWDLPAESATRVGHPAPYPVDLAQALIELHTYEGDLVLDPFMGSGTTAVAARRAGRHYLGIEFDADYSHSARDRVAGVAQVVRVEPVELTRRALEMVGSATAPRNGTLDWTDKSGVRWRVALVPGRGLFDRAGMREKLERIITNAAIERGVRHGVVIDADGGDVVALGRRAVKAGVLEFALDTGQGRDTVEQLAAAIEAITVPSRG